MEYHTIGHIDKIGYFYLDIIFRLGHVKDGGRIYFATIVTKSTLNRLNIVSNNETT